MASDDKLPNIEKLNDANWPIWKLQIIAYLQARELYGLLTGEEQEPTLLPTNPPPSDEDRRKFAEMSSKYIVKAARIKYILFQTVSTSQIHIIAKQDLNTPKLMWDELIGTFDRPSLSNKLDLLTRLLDVRMISGQSIDMYFKDLQDVTERLVSLNVPVNKDMQVAIILRGLSSEFGSLRTAYIAKGDVSIGELREALKTEERRLNNECKNEESALFVSARNNRQNPVRKGPPGSCYGCGKFGHFHRNCPTDPYKGNKKTSRHHAKTVRHSVYNDTDDDDDDDGSMNGSQVITLNC